MLLINNKNKLIRFFDIFLTIIIRYFIICLFVYYLKKFMSNTKISGDWGLGIGDWG